MATKKRTQEDGAAAGEARALVDMPEFGVAAGHLVVADPLTIGGLVQAGKADPHPDAVAYAKALQASET